MRDTADEKKGKSISVWSQSISDVSVINYLVSFYHSRRRKAEVLFYCYVPDTTRDVYLYICEGIPMLKACDWIESNKTKQLDARVRATLHTRRFPAIPRYNTLPWEFLLDLRQIRMGLVEFLLVLWAIYLSKHFVLWKLVRFGDKCITDLICDYWTSFKLSRGFNRLFVIYVHFSCYLLMYTAFFIITYTYIHTTHALSPNGWGISDIPPRHPRFTKIT
jgi:hypothetical protein